MSAAAVLVTSLAIAVYPHGIPNPPIERYSLRCNPARGTVPDPARACRLLARLAHPFAPVPPRTVCAQIAIGPQEAIVTGRLQGKAVRALLRVSDSCEIARWRRLAAVVPGFRGG